MTDYSGLPLEDIIVHLRDWKRNTDEAIELLKKHLVAVQENRERLCHPGNIEDYIAAFIDLFERFSYDFGRLIEELPKGVKPKHVTLVRQMYERSDHEDQNCIYFKHEHIETHLKDESLRFCLMDQIYKDTRGMIIDYIDLSNLAHRLETFADESAPSVGDGSLGVVDIKPNWFGIGINLNPWIRKIARLFKRKKTEP